MKKKKITSILLSLCISLSLMSLPVFGAEIDGKNFEQAIVNVKSIVPISEEYKNFSHSSREIKKDGDTITVWNLEWETDDGVNGGGYISAKIDSYGNLCRYSNYKYDYDSSGLIKVNREKAENTAYEFLKRVLPEYYSDMKIVNTDYNDTYSDEYNFTYQQYINEIPVDFVKVEIGVNKFTGELQSYTGFEEGFKNMDYPISEGIIDIEDAKNRYINNIQNDFDYYSAHNYRTKDNKNFAAYSIDNSKAINAQTGEIVKTNKSGINYYTDEYSIKSAGAVADESAISDLSDVEKEEVSKISGLISKEKAQEIIKESIDLFSNSNPSDVAFIKRYTGDYIWEVNFGDGYAEVDALTGEVVSFYFYGEKSANGSQILNEKEAQEKAEKLLKNIAGNKFTQTKLNDTYSQDEESDFYEFNYIRQINNRNFMSNRLNIIINKYTGNVVEYRSIWYDNVSVADVSHAISKTDAFNKFNDSESFGLQYVLNANNEVELVYDFSKNFPYYIDAVTGKKIDSMGEEYKTDKIPQYDDIQGHWCEKIVKELLDSGYYISEDKFNPNSNISQINFFKYMLSRNMSDYSEDELYEILMDRGIITKEERNANGPVTNKDAAKFITRYLGYEKLAKNSKIFNNMFKDSIDDEYLGYANICYGLNIIKGDSKGNFNGNQCVTNAKAALYIYNIVSMGDNGCFK